MHKLVYPHILMATEPTCLPSTATGTGDSLWHTQKMTYPQANKPTQLTWPWIHKWRIYHGHGYTSGISTMAMNTQAAYLPWPWIHKWHIYHDHGHTSGISTKPVQLGWLTKDIPIAWQQHKLTYPQTGIPTHTSTFILTGEFNTAGCFFLLLLHNGKQKRQSSYKYILQCLC